LGTTVICRVTQSGATPNQQSSGNITQTKLHGRCVLGNGPLEGLACTGFCAMRPFLVTPTAKHRGISQVRVKYSRRKECSLSLHLSLSLSLHLSLSLSLSLSPTPIGLVSISGVNTSQCTVPESASVHGTAPPGFSFTAANAAELWTGIMKGSVGFVGFDCVTICSSVYYYNENIHTSITAKSPVSVWPGASMAYSAASICLNSSRLILPSLLRSTLASSSFSWSALSS